MKAKSSVVIGYLRVSTNEQADSGLGLAHQQAVVAQEAARRGWDDLRLISDEGFSAKNLARPGIAEALALLRKGEASTLVVAKLDRLSRSLLDFASLMQRASREGWELVVLDLALDTATPQGQLMAAVMAAFSEYERQLIGARTSDALQQLRAQGVRLGRPRVMDESISARIVGLRESGATLEAIADELNDAAVPTARGGVQWYPSTVRAALQTAALDREAEAIRAATSEPLDLVPLEPVPA